MRTGRGGGAEILARVHELTKERAALLVVAGGEETPDAIDVLVGAPEALEDFGAEASLLGLAIEQKLYSSAGQAEHEHLNTDLDQLLTHVRSG